MRSINVTPALAAVIIGLVAASVMLAGCSSNDDDGQGVTGGTVTGSTIAATEQVGLGGVLIAIGNLNGQGQFEVVTTAISTSPNGDFALVGVPAGTYRILRVTPSPQIWPQQDVNVLITVADGQLITLGPILVFDDLPPSPIS